MMMVIVMWRLWLLVKTEFLFEANLWTGSFLLGYRGSGRRREAASASCRTFPAALMQICRL